LAAEYHAQGKADYVRVLYGRLCRQMTIAQVAETLEMTPANVDNYFRHAKARLAQELEDIVRSQVQRYRRSEEAEQEFEREWHELGELLAERGGLEEAVHRAYKLLDPVLARRRPGSALTRTLTRITSIGFPSSDASPPDGTT
jgi:hypothetical protein